MKYFIYARKSSDSEERQVLSIEAQLAELNEFAAKENMEIVASLCEAKTAKEPGRTVFAQVLERIERGEAEGILAWHPDRLARNSIDGGKIIYFLDIGKLKDLKFPTFWFESTPQGKFMLSIAFGQSKYYIDNLSENVKRGVRQKLRRGEWPSFAPIGYINNLKTKTLEIDPIKAPIIKKAFEQYATGDLTLKYIQQFFFNSGLKTPKGNSLSLSGIQRTLQRPLYFGLIKWNGEVYPATHEPLISKDLYDRVQNVMRSKGKIKRQRRHLFPFVGFMHCGSCGAAITAELQKGHHYYRCTKKKGPCDERMYLREEDLIDQLKANVQKVSLPDRLAEKMLKKLERVRDEEQSDQLESIQSTEARKSEIDQQLNRLLDLQLNNSITLEEYRQKKNQLVNLKIQLEEKSNKLRDQGQQWLEPMRDLILSSCQAKKFLKQENLEAIRQFLKKIGSNFLLKGKIFGFEANPGWRVLQKQQGFRGWQAHLDLNQN